MSIAILTLSASSTSSATSGLVNTAWEATARQIFTGYRLPWWRAETLHAWAAALTCAGRTQEAKAKHRDARLSTTPSEPAAAGHGRPS